MLLRNSKHNHNTWGLPGGNADREDDGNLKTTAVREAMEEMTVLPEYDVRGAVRLLLASIAQIDSWVVVRMTLHTGVELY